MHPSLQSFIFPRKKWDTENEISHQKIKLLFWAKVLFLSFLSRPHSAFILFYFLIWWNDGIIRMTKLIFPCFPHLSSLRSERRRNFGEIYLYVNRFDATFMPNKLKRAQQLFCSQRSILCVTTIELNWIGFQTREYILRRSWLNVYALHKYTFIRVCVLCISFKLEQSIYEKLERDENVFHFFFSVLVVGDYDDDDDDDGKNSYSCKIPAP